ncbi:Uncharacterised protein [Mycobacteroides abscessus subsp. bolletii]|nr:hypothetical protein [Mycobacteroides abscessus]SKY98748.1 Uncharacterised protein [Mycobacteroides abscessus subsp. bolletii]
MISREAFYSQLRVEALEIAIGNDVERIPGAVDFLRSLDEIEAAE